MYITLIAIWAMWIMSVAFLATSGQASVDKLTGYVSTDQYSHWWAYLVQLFGIIWLTEVVTACHQFMLSAATARYYFYRDKKNFGRGKIIKNIILGFDYSFENFEKYDISDNYTKPDNYRLKSKNGSAVTRSLKSYTMTSNFKKVICTSSDLTEIKYYSHKSKMQRHVVLKNVC
jgi:hypothetical protein